MSENNGYENIRRFAEYMREFDERAASIRQHVAELTKRFQNDGGASAVAEKHRAEVEAVMRRIMAKSEEQMEMARRLLQRMRGDESEKG